MCRFVPRARPVDKFARIRPCSISQSAALPAATSRELRLVVFITADKVPTQARRVQLLKADNANSASRLSPGDRRTPLFWPGEHDPLFFATGPTGEIPLTGRRVSVSSRVIYLQPLWWMPIRLWPLNVTFFFYQGSQWRAEECRRSDSKSVSASS